MHRLNLNRDLVAGLMFAAFGVVGWWIASEYPRGTALRMGPGYMPVMLCWGLMLLGGAIATRGALKAGAKLAGWHLRPLVLILLAILAFALLIEPLGLALATLAIVVIGAAGGPEFRPVEAIALALGLAAGAVGLFAYGLKLSIPLWPAALS
jgi:Tripartite tricarboxylate transporter TctB family